MRTLNLEPTDETPKVIFDPANKVFSISGKSFPENVEVFFNPVLSWLDEYIVTPEKETNFEFRLEYFNTASAKIILDILIRLEKIIPSGNVVSIQWYSKKVDIEMKEAGEEFAEIVDLNFEYHTY
jgi:hypothetical protein